MDKDDEKLKHEVIKLSIEVEALSDEITDDETKSLTPFAHQSLKKLNALLLSS